MAKNIIFYFTGTGNSLKVAKDIAMCIGDCELVSMGKPYKMGGTYEHIGFVYPVYCGGLPAAVLRFIEALDLSQNKKSYIFAVATFGGMSGGLKTIAKMIADKGGKLSYGAGIKCFANYICLYGMANDASSKAKAQEAATKAVIKDIGKRVVHTKFSGGMPLMAMLHGGFLKSAASKDKGFNVSENCNGCGTCSKVCPVRNIRMQGGKPKFQHHCEQCVACVQWCPKQAINYKDKTQNRGRYHHPGVTLEDIIEGK